MPAPLSIVGFSSRPPLQPFDRVLGAVLTAVGAEWAVKSRASIRWPLR